MTPISAPSLPGELEQQARQGHPDAIATLLNQSVKDHNVWVRVGWKDKCLGLLVEGKVVPDAATMAAILSPLLRDLNIEGVDTVRLYGRQDGSRLPAWRQEIQILPVEESDQAVVSLMDWLSQGCDSTQEEPRHLQNSQGQNGQGQNDQASRFLDCWLSGENRILIPLSHIQAVFQLSPTDILPIPNMPDCVVGVHNYRGELLWIVDLSTQLGLGMLNVSPGTAAMSAIALTDQNMTLGVLVTQVLDIQTHPSNLNTDLSHLFPASVVPYLSGYLPHLGIGVLDVMTVLRDPVFQRWHH
jgi:positive phototaxis protein PixI